MKRREHLPMAMPAKTFTKPSTGGARYVYLTARAYRDAAGRPTSDEAMIGKLAPDGVSLVPNQRYFEFYPAEAPPPSSARALGASAALLTLAGRRCWRPPSPAGACSS